VLADYGSYFHNYLQKKQTYIRRKKREREKEKKRKEKGKRKRR